MQGIGGIPGHGWCTGGRWCKSWAVALALIIAFAACEGERSRRILIICLCCSMHPSPHLGDTVHVTSRRPLVTNLFSRWPLPWFVVLFGGGLTAWILHWALLRTKGQVMRWDMHTDIPVCYFGYLSLGRSRVRITGKADGCCQTQLRML